MADIKKAKRFYDQGLRFYHCAQRSLGDVNEDGSIQILGGKYQTLSTPVMVNAAFSCEIFLKSILILHDIDYRKQLKHGEGHKLKSLFDLLPDQRYKDFLQTGSQDDFEKALIKHSADFENWRYYMENPGTYRMSPMFTLTLMENLKTLTHTLIQQKTTGAEAQ